MHRPERRDSQPSLRQAAPTQRRADGNLCGSLKSRVKSKPAGNAGGREKTRRGETLDRNADIPERRCTEFEGWRVLPGNRAAALPLGRVKTETGTNDENARCVTREKPRPDS
ncbi:hypothetical protein EYF80_066222 [Liparis tanakae]|uniref:Uncharacterized protein n=1 Tax=Liparis tanakae TaxID=230148 RepID=A0A4Z2E3Z5_9TELE|nr:hypothetical protein EYF80_066222 [Liparis tanakae]